MHKRLFLLTKRTNQYKMKIDKGSDSMVKMNIRNSQEKTTWGGVFK